MGSIIIRLNYGKQNRIIVIGGENPHDCINLTHLDLV